MTQTTAAIYLRSSKDRHDVSPDAQRRELLALAKAKSLTIVEEFADAVESGKDEHRPAFQALLKTLKSRERAWSVLLALDTSRIARNQYLAHALHFECEKRGIRVIYAHLPETNTVTDVVIRAIFQAFDQLHSLMSREKGLAGMAENVRQGFRAGGRAPTGYRLDRLPTGATRDGAAVTKSKLVPAANAPSVGRYLAARAEGAERGRAARDAGLALATATLVGIEWNALTYAGHTVWNVNAERLSEGGYKGGAKRRPRAQWVVRHDTHPALIATPQAEAILARLERGRAGRYRTRHYLLSGLMFAPAAEGQAPRAWRGDGDGCYRLGKGARIAQEPIERAVVEQIGRDLAAKPFVAALTREARRRGQAPDDPRLKQLRGQISEAALRIGKLAELATQCETPRPFLEQVAIAEKARGKLIEQLRALEAETQSAAVLRAVSEADVEQVLAGLASHMEAAAPEDLKELIAGMVERIELDPVARECRIHYRIAADRGKFLASPRRSDEFPPASAAILRAVRAVRIA